MKKLLRIVVVVLAVLGFSLFWMFIASYAPDDRLIRFGVWTVGVAVATIIGLFMWDATRGTG